MNCGEAQGPSADPRHDSIARTCGSWRSAPGPRQRHSGGAKKQLGYDLDRHLTPQLQRLERQLEQTAKELDALARERELTEEQLGKALRQLSDELDQQEAGGDKEALAGLQRPRVVMPLLEDSARFVALAGRQRDLATRMRAFRIRRNRRPAVGRAIAGSRAEQERFASRWANYSTTSKPRRPLARRPGTR